MPRVLVTDAEQLSAVAAIRALGRAGYEVTAASSARVAAGAWSRSCGRRLRVPAIGEADGGPFARAVGQELAARSYLAVLAGTDQSIGALSAHRETLPVPLPGFPTSAVVERTLDKRLLLDLAATVGLAAPPSAVAGSLDDLLRDADRIGYPVVLKPVSSAEAGVRRTAEVAQDAVALRSAAARYAAPYIVQRRLADAAVLSVGLVVSKGEARAIAVSRFTRTWPADAGSASFCETIVPPEGLVERCTDLCAQLGYEGIAQLDVLEARDGTLALIDLNPRIYTSLALAVRAGANLPAVWCQLLSGDDPPIATARPGVGYRWEEAELMHVLAALRHGQINRAREVATPRRDTVGAIRSLGDPLPAAIRACDVAIRHVRRRH